MASQGLRWPHTPTVAPTGAGRFVECGIPPAALPMTDHAHPLDLDDDALARVDQALATLEEVLGPLVALSAEERTRRYKMGPQTEAFCRQALTLLELNPDTVAPAMELPKMRARMDRFDRLRAQEAVLARMARLLQDARTRVGMELAEQARNGYKALQEYKVPGLQPLQAMFRARYARKPRQKGAAPE